jgi:effector-binding domain-containing protein
MSDPALPAPTIEVRDLPLQHTATVRRSISHTEMPGELARIFELVGDAIGKQSLGPSGPPFARYHAISEPMDVEAGWPVPMPVESDGDVRAGTLPEGPAIHGVHHGDYRSLRQTHEAMQAYCALNGMSPAGGPWESYVTGPATTSDPEKWCTEVIQPVEPD